MVFLKILIENHLWNVVIFPICEKLLMKSHPHMHVLQEANNMLIMQILKLIAILEYISDRHRYQFWTILYLRM